MQILVDAALHMASANGHATIVAFLLDRGAVSNQSPSYESLLPSCHKVSKLLLRIECMLPLTCTVGFVLWVMQRAAHSLLRQTIRIGSNLVPPMILVMGCWGYCYLATLDFLAECAGRERWRQHASTLGLPERARTGPHPDAQESLNPVLDTKDIDVGIAICIWPCLAFTSDIQAWNGDWHCFAGCAAADESRCQRLSCQFVRSQSWMSSATASPGIWPSSFSLIFGMDAIALLALYPHRLHTVKGLGFMRGGRKRLVDLQARQDTHRWGSWKAFSRSNLRHCQFVQQQDRGDWWRGRSGVTRNGGCPPRRPGLQALWQVWELMQAPHHSTMQWLSLCIVRHL